MSQDPDAWPCNKNRFLQRPVLNPPPPLIFLLSNYTWVIETICLKEHSQQKGSARAVKISIINIPFNISLPGQTGWHLDRAQWRMLFLKPHQQIAAIWHRGAAGVQPSPHPSNCTWNLEKASTYAWGVMLARVEGDHKSAVALGEPRLIPAIKR